MEAKMKSVKQQTAFTTTGVSARRLKEDGPGPQSNRARCASPITRAIGSGYRLLAPPQLRRKVAKTRQFNKSIEIKPDEPTEQYALRCCLNSKSNKR